MIKTPIEMLKFVQFIVNDGKEWFLLPEVIEQMKNYAAQFKQVEESDKDRLQKELDAAAFDIDLFEKENERLNEELKKYIGAIDAMMNMSDELTELRKLKK